MTDKMKMNSAIPNPPDIDKSEYMVEQNKRHGKYSNAVIFLVLIFGLTIASIVSKDKGFSENENRVLASKPSFTWDSLMDGTFISKYEMYITDQFIFRDSWIGLKTRVELTLLKKDINGVYFGKDNYLIDKVDDADVDREQMNKNTQRLETFIKKYSSVLGKDHVYAMIAPTAFEILSEKLPPFATGFDQGKYLDLLKSALGKNFIDLRETLNKHDNEDIFYRTDHHWTVLGAYYAYVDWANAMGFAPMSKDEFDIKVVANDFLGTIYSKVNVKISEDTMQVFDSGLNYQVEYNMDGKIKNSLYEFSYLDTKDKYSMYVNGNNAFVEITSENKNGKKLLIIKDSYAHCFAPFAANHFETTYMVDLRYLNAPMSQIVVQYGITDILVLYNTNSFVKDKNLLNLVR